MDNKKAIVFEAIYSRRSIRSFDFSREVEREKILELLRIAMAAPSACNIQPWDFIVVTDGGTVERIKETTGGHGNYNAKVVVVVCGNNEFIPWKDNGVIDCAAAMENIMIAAPLLGLGTVCIGGFDRRAVKDALGIPVNVEPVGMLYMGYPQETKKPRTRYREEAVHWERYDNQREQKPRPGNILVFGPESSI
ncbi:MAG: nitroreductase family protein [Candidatus Lindowbacteria bacterium]|nr:nitroreductase family protein [Candidatus Lindowbacteria bacterium]